MNANEWLKKLIEFNTVSSCSNLKLISAVEDWFLQHKVNVRLTYSEDRQKANLFATIPSKSGESDGGLILSGHTDVVPVEGQTWETDPFDAIYKDDRIYGRGSADMKGFLAVILSLVPMIQKLCLSYPIHFAFSYDEEVGGKGAVHLIKDFLQVPIHPKICIIGEPTLMRPVIAHKGIQVFHCQMTGKATHSSLTPKGCNAIDYAAKLICFIRSLAEKLKNEGPFDAQFDVPFSTISTNRVQGGTALNIIPSACEFFFELRHLPQSKGEAIIQQIESYAQNELMQEMQQEESSAKVQLERLAALPSFVTQHADFLIELISRISDAKPQKVAYATEAGLFAEAQIPTILWGPGSIEQAHGANEFIEIIELKKCESFLLQLFQELIPHLN